MLPDRVIFNVRTLFTSNMTPPLFEYKGNNAVHEKQLEPVAAWVYAVDAVKNLRLAVTLVF